MKILRALVLTLVLVGLPVVGRALYFYRGAYTPAAIVRPDLASIVLPTLELAEYRQAVTKSDGIVLFDKAHNNNFKEAELTVLWSRLTERSSRPKYVGAGEPLENMLRRAKAYVVISPRQPFMSDELRYIKHFVDSGGRLLMITDPTRFEVKYDAMGFPTDRTSDVAVVNTLAAGFGLIFQDDYLYNLSQNSGSFRDLVLTDFADCSLTRGLGKVTVFAAHSIYSDGAGVIMGDKHTRSSLTDRAGGLAVAAVTHNGQVLGLSDFTFMTEPYSLVTDNSRLVSNLADFLLGGERSYELVDFPYFYGDHVALLYTGKEAIGGDVLTQGGLLQRAFDVAGKKLTPRRADSVDQDALYVGLFDGTEFVREELAARGISITLELTATTTAGATPTSTPTPTGTPEPDATPTSDAEDTEDASSTPTPEPIRGTVSVTELGEFPTDSVTLLSLANRDGHPVMIVLAATKEGLAQTLALLAREDLSQCLSSSTAALCPAMPSFPLPPADVYVPPDESDVPMTTTEVVQPIEPDLTPLPEVP